MKKSKKILVLVTAILTIGAIGFTVAAAATYTTPAEAVAGLTGRTEEDVIAEKTEEETTYGAIAAEAGVSEEFREAMIEIKEDRLDAAVEEGRLTQEEADAILARLQENVANCDGTAQHQGEMNGEFKLGCGNGGEKRGTGNGDGSGLGGQRKGQGSGQGGGARDGSCGLG
ncbi:MAG: hypothetical protein PHF65_07065 [Oscillospiraceae bacterium]|nr:hypothetical protein [Oscillospiraceae bacterium]